MKNYAVALMLSGLACSGPADAPSSEALNMTQEMLGRWNVNVQGEDPFPLWFELTEENGELAGFFQPRGGHTLPIDTVEISGDELTFNVAETKIEARFVNDGWKGSVLREDGSSHEWIAARAPVLKAAENREWGEPMELFNGKDLSGWVARDPSQTNMWAAEDGVLANKDKGVDLVTEATFEDFKLHIEVNCPAESNSGIYLRGRYEVQVQDDYGKEAHSRHLGGLYGRITPTENAAKPAGEWQVFDITLLGRWVSVELNGKLIIDHKEIAGITGGALDSNESEPGPLMLQGDHGAVAYRNITVRPLVK